MLKTTLKKLSNKNTNNLAIKSTFLFMSLFILMLVIFSTVLMIVFSHHSDNIITRSNTWALEQMATATDKYLFEKIDYLCDTYFNTNSENARIKKFFSNMNDMSFDEMKTMQQEISDIKKQNPFIDNVILYNGQFDSIVRTPSAPVPTPLSAPASWLWTASKRQKTSCSTRPSAAKPTSRRWLWKRPGRAKRWPTPSAARAFR